VREAYRPGRWMWEIVDARDGTVFEREFEFDFAADARRSGLARLAELAPSLPGAKIAGRNAGSVPANRLVIVSRTQGAMYADLHRLFRENGAVSVIRDRRRSDRRTGDRRVGGELPNFEPLFERRRTDRRSGYERRSRRIDDALTTRGWSVVPRADGERVRTTDVASA
jgi:hypothetical protein